MGGIKNKLKQLSNKVANLVFSTRLGSSVRRSLLDGVDNKTFNLASTARGGGLRSKPVGLLSITKYASIACFTLALISTIGLNLYRTYSSSNVRTNAVDGSTNSELAAQADIDPASISISISSYPSSSSTGGNDPNLSLSIPQGGGIATGRHTVIVETGSSVIGYELQLGSNSDETGLVNNEDDNVKTNTIPAATGTITSPSQLADKSYGYTLANLDNDSSLVNTNIWIGLKPSTNPDTITTVDESNLTIGQANTTIHNIYYGVNIQNPVETRAGDYTRQVVYTVVGGVMLEPTVEDLVLNSSWTDTTPDTAYGSTSILTGQNLSGVTGVYIDLNGNETKDSGEEVTNLAHGTGDEASTKLTFTAPTYTQEGQKNVYLEWPGGDPVKIENGWNYVEPSVCKSGTNNGVDGGDCYIDIDDNMTLVYYTGSDDKAEWSIVPDCTNVDGHKICGSTPRNTGAYGDVDTWYDYDREMWANAVTLRDDFKQGCYVAYVNFTRDGIDVTRYDDEATCNNMGGSSLTPLEAVSVIGDWLGKRGNNISEASVAASPGIEYNNRHLYSLPLDKRDILGYWVYVPRYSYEVMRRDAIDLVQQPEDFKIKFETISPYTPKKSPVAGCSTSDSPRSYRIGCGKSRRYIGYDATCRNCTVSGTTWATHPAFTWMDADGNPVELNGIWVGKFETTGSTEEPTVLPNEKHMSLVSGNIGDMYDVAKSMGIEDKNNKYGNTTSTNLPNQNNNHLATSTSHMLKNSEWGAVAYLSASRYGAGVNNVQINANASSGNDGNDDSSYGVTGCGPNGSSQYNTENGQLASTTNNIYGVYDMAGGAYEYVMGSYTNDSTQSYPSNGYITNKVKPPYVDLYVNPPFNGNEGANNNLCTWTTCGGHALFETAGWGDDYFYFVYSSNPWFLRGGYANADSAGTGVFYSGVSNGRTLGSNSFRVGLAALSAM